MNIARWLARAASLADRLRRKADRPSTNDDAKRDPQSDRRRAKRSLATRLPPHLRRDVGAEDD